MNAAAVTTGFKPLTIGSNETFQLQAFDNGRPWNLTGGSGQLLLADPSGNITTINGTIQGQGVVANWTVVGPVGNWARAWKVTDASGRTQISVAFGFTVQSSPA